MRQNYTISSLKFLFLLIVCACCQLQAQDTIVKRNGIMVPAKILEIGIRDISYKRADNPDGPLIIESKNEIAKIRYANGRVDTFAVSINYAPNPVIQSPQVSTYSSNTSNYIEAGPRPGSFYYKDRILSEKNMLLLAETKNLSCRNKELRSEIEKTRNARTIQYVTGFSSLGIGLLSIYTLSYGTSSSTNSSASNNSLAWSFASINLVIGSQIASNIFKGLRAKHSRRVAQLYNTCP